MATFFISYFGTVDKGVAGDPIKAETVTTSATSARSAVIPSGAVIAKIQSDTAHYVTIGDDPAATQAGAGMAFAAAGELLWLRTDRHGLANYKIAAVTAS